MSFQAMTWAIKQECGSAAAKLVLLMLADRTNHDTGNCFPRQKTLAQDCEMRVETLKTHLKNLEDRGLITIVPRYADGVQLANSYTLNLWGGGGENHPGGGGEKRPPVNQEVNQEYKSISWSTAPAELSPEAMVTRPHTKKTAVTRKEQETLFTSFWEAYPRKVGKDAAMRAFAKRKVDAALLETMLKAVRVQSVEWEDPKYIPHPATWLNAGRWQDEGATQTRPAMLIPGAI